MKYLILFSIFLTFFSCHKELKDESVNEVTVTKPSEVENLDFLFHKWLNNKGFKTTDIVDSTEHKQFEFWAYYNELTNEDSLLHWFPSKDSSYYLITNYDTSNHKRITNKMPDIQLSFLDTKSEKLYIGMYLLDSLQKRKIDFYWYDSTTFYFLEPKKEVEAAVLFKLKMQTDSLWRYEF